MKKHWIITLFSFSIAISVVAVIISFSEIESISVEGADLLGWIIGILSLLVTVLITWQIINVLSFERELNKKIKSSEEKLNTLIKDEIKRELKHLTAMIHHNLNVVCFDMENYSRSFIHLIFALVNSEPSTEKEWIDYYIKYLKIIIEICTEEKIKIRLNDSDYKRCKEELIKLQDERVIEIINFMINDVQITDEIAN